MPPYLTMLIASATLAPQTGSGVRQSIRDAAIQIRDAATQAKDAQQRVRDANQQIRDAEQQLQQARTPDQRGAADQALFGARATLRDAQQALEEAANQMDGPGRLVFTTTQPARGGMNDSFPPQLVDISIGFFITCAVMVVGWPISRALGRRIERKAAQSPLSGGMNEQVQRIEQSVEAMAIEIERISEAQRFMAKLQQRSAVPIEP